MNDTIEEFKHAGCTIRIERDDDPPDNRKDCDNLGHMVCWHRRYDLGDETHHDADRDEYIRDLVRPYINAAMCVIQGADEPEIPQETIQAAFDEHFTRLDLYLYDHSGLSMATHPFHCRWDSGWIGWIHVSLDKVRAEVSSPHAGWDTKFKRSDGKFETLRQYAKRVLEAEVKEYNYQLTGECYGYIVEDKDGNHVDSCWGYYGYCDGSWDYMIECAKGVAESHRKELLKKKLAKTKAYIKNNVPLSARTPVECPA